MPDVFISHVEADAKFASEVARGLRAAGYDTWSYEDDGLPGVSYLEQAGAAIERSRVFLLLISGRSLSSEHVDREVERALQSARLFLPVLLDMTCTEFLRLGPAWRMAIGIATCVASVPEAGASAIMPRLLQGLRALGVEPAGAPGTAAPAAPPSPDRPQGGDRFSIGGISGSDPIEIEVVPVPFGERPLEPLSPALPASIDLDTLDVRPNLLADMSRKNVVHEGGSPLPLDNVYFSATSPRSVRRSRMFGLDVWAHLAEQRPEVLQRAREEAPAPPRIKTQGPALLERGISLTVHVQIDGLRVQEPTAPLVWNGLVANAGFLVEVGDDAVTGQHAGCARIRLGDLAIAHLAFIVEVGGDSDTHPLLCSGQMYRTAFASHASEDRDQVLLIVQGMQKEAPNLKVYYPPVDMRSGQHWEHELMQIIPTKDVFYLFWSRAASKSTWVEREWRCALEHRGLDFIDVAPLESPELAPPPPELAWLHFDDWTLAYRRRDVPPTS
jgi:hypothetical protein